MVRETYDTVARLYDLLAHAVDTPPSAAWIVAAWDLLPKLTPEHQTELRAHAERLKVTL